MKWAVVLAREARRFEVSKRETKSNSTGRVLCIISSSLLSLLPHTPYLFWATPRLTDLRSRANGQRPTPNRGRKAWDGARLLALPTELGHWPEPHRLCVRRPSKVWKLHTIVHLIFYFFTFTRPIPVFVPLQHCIWEGTMIIRLVPGCTQTRRTGTDPWYTHIAMCERFATVKSCSKRTLLPGLAKPYTASESCLVGRQRLSHVASWYKTLSIS